jgi:hypothetical protein
MASSKQVPARGRGRPRVTNIVNGHTVQRATAVVKRNGSLVAYAVENNYNYAELAAALKAKGVTLVRGRKAVA